MEPDNTNDDATETAELPPLPAYDAERFAVVALDESDHMTTLGYPFTWTERGTTRGHGATERDCVLAILRYSGVILQ